MRRLNDKPLLLSMGDPNGIGPEITAQAWQALRTQTDLAFAVIAPPDIFKSRVPIMPLESLKAARHAFKDALPIWPLENTAETPASAITQSIETAVEFCLSGEAAGLVTNPISKDVLYKAGFEFPGHTEYLGALTAHAKTDAHQGPVMMLAAQDLRVGLATVHIPLKKVSDVLSKELIVKNAMVILRALQSDFGIKTPRLALTGLNPHAGENGALGREDIEIINPAAQTLRDMGYDVTDAQPADTLFHVEARQGYDAVLAMYHDQGLIPVKTLDFHGGVNITLGLPILRTSPDHGTAFDIAGQNIARPDSLIAAIRQARNIANQRAKYALG